METGVSVVICCGEAGLPLLETIESVERQRGGAVEVVLAHDGSADDRHRQFLAELSRRRRVGLVQADAPGSGAVRNAGLRATRGGRIVMIDPGDFLGPSYVEQAGARLEAEPDLAFVTPWVWMESPDAGSFVSTPIAADLPTLLARPDSIHGSSMFRRRVWETVGGFDASLEALDVYDFWIRVLAHGYRGGILEEAFVHHRIRAGSACQRTLERARYAASIRAVYEKHRKLFETDPAGLLSHQERYIRELEARHDPLERRRADGIEELRALDEEINRLEALLSEGGVGVDWGDLRRLSPVSRNWGYERGKPVDRHYIERFLEANAEDIRGIVLEVQESDYTARFGGARVQRSDVVDVDPANPRATIVADLRDAAGILTGTYDCIILTQTLHVIDDMRAALAECLRVLKPGGVLLATLPCLSRVCLEYGPAGDFWRVTEAGARKVFSEFFPVDGLDIRACGNVLVGAAFLYGLAAHELTPAELDAFDPYFPLLVSVRAVKPGTSAPRAPGAPRAPRADVRTSAPEGWEAAGTDTRAAAAGAILLYHRVAEPATDFHGLCVSPGDFREHMRHLRRHYQPMGLDDLAAALGRGTVPIGAVAVTFDDGYVDSLTTASPILVELGVPATFFLDSEHLGGAREFWWDALERILLSGGSVPGRLELMLGDRMTRFATATADERKVTHGALHEALVTASVRERDETMRRIGAWSGLDLSVRRGYRGMTGPEIRRLAERPGHAVGGHGAHHLALPAQPHDARRREVVDNKAQLEGLIGRPVLAFAYPFGAHDDATVEVIRAASLRIAVTCEPNGVRPGLDPLRLPRLDVKASSAEQFAEFLKRHVARR